MNEAISPERAAAFTRIQEVVGDKGWTQDAGDMAPHLVEERGMWSGSAAMLVRPNSTEEVAAVVAICNEARIPIVPQGGNTSLCGASIPFDGETGIILSLSRMNQVREIDVENNTMTVDAGCILKSLQDRAADVDRLFPLSLGAEGSCQIGGNLSTNAGGVAVLRYGNARELVLGVEVVLPDGQIWNGLRGLRKNNSGYDLKHLFVGAEGTLGIITAAVVKLFPRPKEKQTAFAAIADPYAAATLLGRIRSQTGDSVTGYEIMCRDVLEMSFKHIPGAADPLSGRHDWYLLIELSGMRADDGLRTGLEEVLAQAMEDGLVADAVIAESLDQANALWHLREALPEAQKFEGGSIKHDVAVPVSRVADFIVDGMRAVEEAMPGIRPVPFGHVGDGNIHFNLSQPIGADRDAFMAEFANMNRLVHDIVEGMGGTFSAEHGVGRLKIDEMKRYRSDVELNMMRAIKALFDPNGIMNPGKVL